MEEKNTDKMCGAKTRSGEPCRRPPVPQGRFWISGNLRCHLHGGKSLAGYAHPNFKHGRYSKVINGLHAEEIAAEKAKKKRQRAINKACREFEKKYKRQPTFEEFSRIVNVDSKT